MTTKRRRTVLVDQTHELLFEDRRRLCVYAADILHELITRVPQIGHQPVGRLERSQTGFEIVMVLPFGRLQQFLDMRGEG